MSTRNVKGHLALRSHQCTGQYGKTEDGLHVMGPGGLPLFSRSLPPAANCQEPLLGLLNVIGNGSIHNSEWDLRGVFVE